MPSFASELRRQLAARTGEPPGDDPHRRIELAGLVEAAGESDGSGVTVRTSSAAVARSVVRLWRSEFGLEPRLDTSGPDRFRRARYAVRVEGNGAVQAAEELVERYRAEGAAPVVVDREEIQALGARVRETDLTSKSDVSAGVRHDAARLAEEVREVALVRL